MKKVFILDTSAILSVQQTLTYFSKEESGEGATFLTTPEIVTELKDSISKLRIESMISSQALFVKDANIQYKAYIEEICKKIGNYDRLSSQDKSIIALAWQEKEQQESVKTVLLTDDFEIQNTAKILKMEFRPIKTAGIRYTAKFKKMCQACGEILLKEDTFCPECGSTKFKMKKLSYSKNRQKQPIHKS